jgi:2-aminoadipate transaminase
LRLGWIVAPTAVIAKLVQLKQGADLHTSTFTQMVAYEVARGGFLDEHVHQLRAVYRERRDVMLEALDAFFPAAMGASWTHPAGGLFLWLRLPDGLTARVLLEAAVRSDVAFVPGDAFFADPGEGEQYCRLNFSNARPEQITEGIRRLSQAVRQMQGTPEAEMVLA